MTLTPRPSLSSKDIDDEEVKEKVSELKDKIESLGSGNADGDQVVPNPHSMGIMVVVIPHLSHHFVLRTLQGQRASSSLLVRVPPSFLIGH